MGRASEVASGTDHRVGKAAFRGGGEGSQVVAASFPAVGGTCTDHAQHQEGRLLRFRQEDGTLNASEKAGSQSGPILAALAFLCRLWRENPRRWRGQSRAGGASRELHIELAGARRVLCILWESTFGDGGLPGGIRRQLSGRPCILDAWNRTALKRISC